MNELFVQAIKRPLTEFHSMVTHREELTRIKRITAITTQSSLATKVATKIQAERPAERPVLTGLIQEETEKTTLTLRRQMQSAMNQLELIKKQHTTLSKQLQK